MIIKLKIKINLKIKVERKQGGGDWGENKTLNSEKKKIMSTKIKILKAWKTK